MFEKIFDIVKTNLKNPKLYITLLVLLVIILLLFPYIDANVFYYQRVNNRVEVLSKISELDTDRISNNEILQAEYHSILQELEKQKDGSLGSVFKTNAGSSENLFKFISGGLLFWILAFVCIFIKSFKRLRDKVLGIILCVVAGGIIGFIASLLPTIINPFVNYIGFPILILIIIGILATRKTDK